jgi:glycosyltransferase involved in cell wall biosynthesis
MKCLHLFSDWKWTGPAEPVVSLCEALADTRLDVRLAFRAAPAGYSERNVGTEVAKRNVRVYDGFRLNRYFSVKDWFFDLRSIGRYAAEERIDIIHTHLTHDHSEAALALFGGRTRPLLVRTDHKRDGLEKGFFMKRLLRRTDGLAAYGQRIIDADIEHLDYPRERSVVLPPGVRQYAGPIESLKGSLGIAEDEKVIGVIGRLKPDRGFDIILKAFKLVRERVDKVKLVIVGRSSQIEESVKKPLAALGLEEDVILAGYRLDDYFSMISTFDLFVMMRAGSDGTARALREVLGMGKAAIVSDRGMLPELVQDGVTGFVVSDEHQLAARMEQLVSDDRLRAELGAAAGKRAVEEWDYRAQATRVIEFYEELVARGPRK